MKTIAKIPIGYISSPVFCAHVHGFVDFERVYAWLILLHL